MALVTLAAFQLQVGVGPLGSSADQSFLDAADAAVKRYIHWDPERSERTEYLDGTGISEIVLPGLPVDQVVSEVRFDGNGGYGQVPNSFGSDTILTQGVSYFADTKCGMLRMWRAPTNGWWWFPGGGQVGPSLYWGGLSNYGVRPAFWPRIPGACKVTWTNGYEAGEIPNDLQASVIQLAAYLRNSQVWGGLMPGSMSYIDTSASLQAATNALTSLPDMGSARSMLRPYISIPQAGGIR